MPSKFRDYLRESLGSGPHKEGAQLHKAFFMVYEDCKDKGQRDVANKTPPKAPPKKQKPDPRLGLPSDERPKHLQDKRKRKTDSSTLLSSKKEKPERNFSPLLDASEDPVELQKVNFRDSKIAEQFSFANRDRYA